MEKMEDNEMENKLISQYVNSLNEQERKTLKIAKDHLGTSFNIKKSIGYLNWKKNITNK